MSLSRRTATALGDSPRSVPGIEGESQSRAGRVVRGAGDRSRLHVDHDGSRLRALRGSAVARPGIVAGQEGPRYLLLLSLRKYSATEPSQPCGTLSPPGLRTLP